jgi:plasmid segregation protein ParM
MKELAQMTKTLNVIDLGNGDIKIASNHLPNVESFPAVIGSFSSPPTYKIADKDRKFDSMSFIKDNREYAIGANAIRNCKNRNHDITEDKYLSETTIVLSNAALTLMAPTTLSIANVLLALPVHKMNIAHDVIRLFKGHTFGGRIGFFGKYENISRVVQVENVIAIEQPWGTLFKHILDDNGKIIKESAKKGIAIFDIGFKTNDGIVFRNLDMIGRLTIHSKSGMFIAFDEIQSKINQQFGGLEVKIFEVPDIVRSGEVRGIKIPEIINDALYNLAYNIILEIKSKWADAWEIEEIIFTGGGAELLKPYLIQAFAEAKYEKASSNAEGLLRYARHMWGDVS